MQSDFSYIQDGKAYSAKLWNDSADAEKHAQALSAETTQLHNTQPIGEKGWVCVSAAPNQWVDAQNAVLVVPQAHLQFQRLRQAVRDCRVHLALDCAKALEQVRKSWARLNPLKLSAPKENDYDEAAFITVFMLYDPESSHVSLEEGVQLIFEQGFNNIPQEGEVSTLSNRLTSWWQKSAA